MRDLPISSVALIWTDKGLKIVTTDDCGDMVGLSSFRTAPRRRVKLLPESLLRLAASSCPPAPESGADAYPTS